MNTITVKETISIKSNKEQVWDFTQDFYKRKSWDQSILEFKIIQKKPSKLIWIKTVGGISAKLKYKVCDKAHKTTLKLIDVKSLIIKGGGGSWRYETHKDITKWTQVNSLVFKNKMWYLVFGKLLKRRLKSDTKKAMLNAKLLIEKNE